MVEYTAIVIIDIPDDCIEDCGDLEQETDEKAEAVSTPLVIVGLLVIFVVISLLVRARTRGDEEIPETWHNEEIAPERDERIPDGWSLEEFLDWLDGPIPDEWEEEQWETYRSSLEDLR